jgi:hypothetical protein
VKGKVSLIVFATVVAQMAFAPNSQAQITIAPTTSTSIVPITTTSVTQVFNPLTELFEPKTTTTTTFQTITTTNPANVSDAVAAAAFVANQNTNSISDSNTQLSLLSTRLAVLTQQPIQEVPNSILTTRVVVKGDWVKSGQQDGDSGSKFDTYKCSTEVCDGENPRK